MNKNSQSIVILCSNLCVGDGVVPLRPSEWKKLADRLLKKSLEPKDILELEDDSLMELVGFDESLAGRIKRLIGRSASLFFEVEKYEHMGISIVTRADEGYPPLLRKKLGNSCPPLFFYTGDLVLARKKGIGFEGSRFLTTEDEDFERSLAKKVVEAGYVVVSGGASGADEVAENVAIESPNGKVIEFSGRSIIARLRHSSVIKAIQEKRMLLLSATNPDAGFSVGNAMARNRFICAQSDAVIAIKSINKGGTWNGVTDNLKQGLCPAFCWNNSNYPENLELIKLGAIPIDSSWEVSDIKSCKVAPYKNNKQKLTQIALI